jgi:manganese oxidase
LDGRCNKRGELGSKGNDYVTPIRTIACLIVATLGFVPTAADAVERTYFIAADEVVWDFAPSYPNNPIIGDPFTKEESVFLRHAKDRIRHSRVWESWDQPFTPE